MLLLMEHAQTRLRRCRPTRQRARRPGLARRSIDVLQPSASIHVADRELAKAPAQITVSRSRAESCCMLSDLSDSHDAARHVFRCAACSPHLYPHADRTRPIKHSTRNVVALVCETGKRLLLLLLQDTAAINSSLGCLLPRTRRPPSILATAPSSPPSTPAGRYPLRRHPVLLTRATFMKPATKATRG